MTCTPDRTAGKRLTRAGLSALLPALLLGLTVPGWTAPSSADDLVSRARMLLANGDGVGAEVTFRQALAAGAGDDRVAAGMGEALLAQGKLDDARKWLVPARFAVADMVTGLRALSRLEIASGNLPAAGQALDRAIQTDNHNADLWVDVAQLRWRGGEQLQSADAADQALAIDAGNVRALDFKALLIRDRFGPAASLPWFEAALLRAPNDGAVLADYAATLGDLGRAKDMLAVTRKMIDSDAQAPRAFFLQAVLAARAGNAALARSMLNRAGEGASQSPARLQIEGLLQLHDGNAVLAVESFRQLAASQPLNQQATLFLARALYDAGQIDELLNRFLPLAQRLGASPYLLTLVGRSLEDLGRRDEAAGFLDRASARPSGGLGVVPAIDEGDAEPLRFDAIGADGVAAQVRFLLANGRGQEGVALAGRLRMAVPGMAAAQALEADALFASGDAERAFTRYREAAAIRLDDALLPRLAMAAARSGHSPAAGDLVAGYLAANPASRQAMALAADMAAAGGDWKRAVSLLDHVRATGSGRDVQVLANLGLGALRSGDRRKAEWAAQVAWQVQRMNPMAAEALLQSLPDDAASKDLRLVLRQRLAVR